MAASRRHFSHEERLFFPLLERVVQPATLTAMGTAWFLQTPCSAQLGDLTEPKSLPLARR